MIFSTRTNDKLYPALGLACSATAVHTKGREVSGYWCKMSSATLTSKATSPASPSPTHPSPPHIPIPHTSPSLTHLTHTHVRMLACPPHRHQQLPEWTWQDVRDEGRRRVCFCFPLSLSNGGWVMWKRQWACTVLYHVPHRLHDTKNQILFVNQTKAEDLMESFYRKLGEKERWTHW